MLIFVALIFTIGSQYDKEIPKIFWFILYLIHWGTFFILKRNKRILILTSLSIIIIIQICLLLFPYFYNIIFNLFNKISFA